MVCPKCGAQNPDNAAVCGICGNQLSLFSNQPQTFYTQPAPASVPGKGLAIAGMVCGIVSFFCCGFILGLLAIIFGGVAKSKGFRGGQATAAIVLGVVGLALTFLMWIIFGSFLGAVGSLV